jgi:hypothetical protein
MKIKVNLFDVLTNHSKPAYGFRTFSPFVEPKCIDYLDGGQDVSVYTDKSLNRENVLRDPAKVKVAWLVECREVHPFAYEQVLRLENLFDYIFTFDEELLNLGDKYIKTPIASSRIIDRHSKIYKKRKNTSMIVSKKSWCSGHKYRHEIVSKLKNTHLLDLWGEAFKPMPQGAKILALAEYRYSIVVENSKGKNYFTEKLIDCFRTGTIPIYWGSSAITEHFNMGGIICFDTIKDLDDLIPSLTEDRYGTMIEALRENYKLASKWTSMDDTFANNLKEITNG